MRRLLAAEWRKLSCQRAFRILVAGVLLLQIVLVLQAGRLPHEENSALYRQALAEAMKGQRLPVLLDAYEAEEKALLDQAAGLDPQIGFIDQASYERFFEVVLPMQRQLRRVLQFNETIRNRISEIDKKLILPLYARSDSYAAVSLRQQKANYQQLAGIQPELGPEKGIHVLSSLQFSDYLLIMAVFVLAALVLGADRELGMGPLIHTQAKSKGAVFQARLLLVMLLALIFALVLWGLAFGYAALAFGLGRLQRPLQSLPLYNLADVKLSVGGFLLRMILLKGFTALLIAALCSLIISMSKNTVFQYALFLLTLAGSFLLWVYIPDHSRWQALKYMNLFGLLDVVKQHQGSSFLRVSGRPVPWFQASLLISLLFTLACHGLARLALRLEKAETPERIKRFPAAFRVRQPFSLALLEARRLFVDQKGLFVLLIVLSLSLLTINQQAETHYDKQREFYLDYYLLLRGELTDTTMQRMNQIALSFEEGSGSPAPQEDARLAAYQQSLNQAKQEAFLRLKNQIDASAAYRGAAFPVEVIDEKSADFWFDNPALDAAYGLLASLAMLFAGFSVTWRDRKLQMLPLLLSTPRGHQQVHEIRVGLLFWLAALLSLSLSLPPLISAQGQNRLLPLHAVVQSAPELLHFGPAISFGWLAFVLLLYRLCALFLQGLLFLWFIRSAPGIWTALAGASTLVLLPQFLTLALPSLKISGFLPFSNAFLIASVLDRLNAPGLAGYSGLAVLLCVLMGLTLRRTARAPQRS